mgnify:CR=1 FL=1
MELNKLYGQYYNNYDSKIKKEIEDYIKNNYNDLDNLNILYNIINKFIPFANENENYFCFIIDQVSFSKDYYNNNKKLYEIMKIVKKCSYLKLIICTTLNNDFSKESMNNILNEVSSASNDLYSFYYFQNFYSKKDIEDNIFNDENDEIKDTMHELGDLPGHYYEIKRDNNVESYIQYVKNKINENMKNYYKEYNIKQLLDLIDLIYGEKVLSSVLLKERIRNIPLKYIVIKKFKINKEFSSKFKKSFKNDTFLEYLELLLFNYRNIEYDKIFKEHYDFKEINPEDFLIQYLEKDKDSRNLFGNFYEEFIEKNKLNLNSPKKEIEIYVYIIKFSMDLIKKIIFEKIHNYLQSQYHVFLKFFSNGVIGGFFEVLINFSIIKNKFELFNIKIEEVIQMKRIVPSQFSIRNYSSKREKIKFKMFKIIEKKGKKA